MSPLANTAFTVKVDFNYVTLDARGIRDAAQRVYSGSQPCSCVATRRRKRGRFVRPILDAWPSPMDSAHIRGRLVGPLEAA